MVILPHPRALADLVEIDPQLPPGGGERFSGYGVMGLPFQSGHVLALRRFPASSLGYAYATVWHRTPDGRWTFWSDVEPDLSCARFFGEAVAEVGIRPIRLTWRGSHALRVTVGDGIVDWWMTLRGSAVTAAMNAAARLLPDGVRRWPGFLSALGRTAGPLLGAGRIGLVGRAPNGQRFEASPLQIWHVGSSSARVGGAALGPPGPLREQAWLGDFAIPQRGIFAIARTTFESFHPGRHSSVRGHALEATAA